MRINKIGTSKAIRQYLLCRGAITVRNRTRVKNKRVIYCPIQGLNLDDLDEIIKGIKHITTAFGILDFKVRVTEHKLIIIL